MKNDSSIFEKYIKGELDLKDIEGIRFLDPDLQKDAKTVFDPEFVKYLKIAIAKQRIIKTLNKIEKRENKLSSEFNTKSYTYSKKIVAMVACLILVLTNWQQLEILNDYQTSENIGSSNFDFSPINNKRKQLIPIAGKKLVFSTIIPKSLKYIELKNNCGLVEISPKPCANTIKSNDYFRLINNLKIENLLSNQTTYKTRKTAHFLRVKRHFRDVLRSKSEETYYIEEPYNSKNNIAAINNSKRFKYKVKNINEAIELDPRNPSLYIKRGWLYEERKNLTLAEADFKKAIRLDPNNIELHLTLLWFHQANREYKKVDADYAKIIQLDRNNPRWYKERAFFYTAIGFNFLAEQDINKVIQLSPQSVEGYKMRSWFYKETNRVWKAKKARQKYLELIGLEQG